MKHVVVFYLMNQCKVTHFEPMDKIWFPKCLSQGHTSCESTAYFLSKIILGVVSSKIARLDGQLLIISELSSKLLCIRHWRQNHWPSFLQRQKSASPLNLYPCNVCLWWFAVFMGHLILIGLKHITCWLGKKTPWLCISSHHVLWFHCVHDGWSVFYLLHICTSLIISLISFTIWEIIVIVVVEQNQNCFPRLIFTISPPSPSSSCTTYFIILEMTYSMNVFQLQILHSTQPVIMKKIITQDSPAIFLIISVRN